MFNLEGAIDGWKHRVRQAESVTQANIDELEGHLREGIAAFVAKGLTEEEAFLVASMRLGEEAVLSQEYGKVNGAAVRSRRIVWMLVGYVGGVALASGISGISACVGMLSAYLGFGGLPTGVAEVIAGFAGGMMVIFWLCLRTRRNDGAPEHDFTSAGWLAVLAAVMAAGAGTGIFGRMVHAQLAAADQFSTSMQWTGIGGLATHVCMIAACVAIILTTKERSRSQSALNLNQHRCPPN